MRLIDTRSESFTIKEFVGEIPAYAILSHTWGEEEVTLQDMQSSLESAKKKRGFPKIQGCCDLARKQGIDYAWVDTCCIDKTNNAELSEAINSMYRYDVPPIALDALLNDKYDRVRNSEPFKRSRWFSRGWTLQELVAPQLVEFYASDWGFLGTKEILRSLIESVTGIRSEVLSDGFSSARLSTYSVAERMQTWARERTTTRIEDRAYSLLGIFNVNMPLIYGEVMKAFYRL
ncbi:HET-domain-containing protein [Xylaria cf. heliscus]|nr:HET-domain-containing protein [Xylaria cf. heliscus]